MKSSRRFPGGFTLEAKVEMIEVSECLGHTERDETWEYEDLAGHRHTWNSNTWTRIQDESNWFDSDGMEHNGDHHNECLACHEHLVPGTIYFPPSLFRQFIPGMTTYTLIEESNLGGGIVRRHYALTEEEATIWIAEHS